TSKARGPSSLTPVVMPCLPLTTTWTREMHSYRRESPTNQALGTFKEPRVMGMGHEPSRTDLHPRPTCAAVRCGGLSVLGDSRKIKIRIHEHGVAIVGAMGRVALGVERHGHCREPLDKGFPGGFPFEEKGRLNANEGIKILCIVCKKALEVSGVKGVD